MFREILRNTWKDFKDPRYHFHFMAFAGGMIGGATGAWCAIDEYSSKEYRVVSGLIGVPFLSVAGVAVGVLGGYTYPLAIPYLVVRGYRANRDNNKNKCSSPKLT